MKKCDWIILDTKLQAFRCMRCMNQMPAPWFDHPADLKTVLGVSSGFIKAHSKCKEGNGDPLFWSGRAYKKQPLEKF